jgi:hypothetical protein
LQPEKLSEKASRIAQDANNILEIVDRFEPAFEKLWRNPIRLSVVLEIDKAKQLVMEQVEKENKVTAQYPTIYGNDEIWIYAYNDGFFHNLSVTRMKKNYARGDAAQLTRKDRVLLPASTFDKAINSLKTKVLEGKLDDQLHLTARHLIFNEMDKTIY